MSQQTILALCYFFHLVATVIWVGGLLILSALVLPEAQRIVTDHPTLDAFIGRLRRRFTPLSNFSLAVLIVTGMIQMSGDTNYDGVLQFTNDWSRVILVKHVLVAAMVGCGLLAQYAVVPAIERTRLLAARGKADPAQQERLRQRERRLAWLNAGLGVGVLALSAWATSI